MHKFELGVGQDFPLAEASPEEEDRSHRHRHHRCPRHHRDDARHHHRDDTHHHMRMAMLALLFALKDHRRRMHGREGAL